MVPSLAETMCALIRRPVGEQSQLLDEAGGVGIYLACLWIFTA